MSRSPHGQSGPARSRVPAVGVFLAALAVASGCANTAPPRVAATGTTTELSNTTGRGTTIRGDEAASTALRYTDPVPTVWPIVQRALTAAGVPLDVIDHPSRTAGTSGARIRRTLGTTRLSTYLRCGASAGSIDVADDHVVTFGALATVRAVDGGGSAVHVQVAGSAKDPFTSVPARECVSTGALEARIDSTIKAMLSPS